MSKTFIDTGMYWENSKKGRGEKPSFLLQSFIGSSRWVHLIFENILVGAKHFGGKSLIITHKLCAEMLRPGPNEMHRSRLGKKPVFWYSLSQKDDV